MKNMLLDKYKDYLMPHNVKDEVFKMMQKEDENLEYFVERFAYNVKRAKMHNLDEETLKDLLLKSNRDELVDLLNSIGKGDFLSYHLEKFVNFVHTFQKERLEPGKNQGTLLCLGLTNLQLG